jgi:hypothetical protein
MIALDENSGQPYYYNMGLRWAQTNKPGRGWDESDEDDEHLVRHRECSGVPKHPPKAGAQRWREADVLQGADGGRATDEQRTAADRSTPPVPSPFTESTAARPAKARRVGEGLPHGGLQAASGSAVCAKRRPQLAGAASHRP